MGRAVVASDVGSTNHVVRDGENGMLVPAGDAPAMREALSRLMGDEALRQRLGRAARATIERDHSYAAYVDRFAAGLRSVLAAKARRAAGEPLTPPAAR